MSYFANFGSKLLNTVLDTVDRVLEDDDDEDDEVNNNKHHRRNKTNANEDDGNEEKSEKADHENDIIDIGDSEPFTPKSSNGMDTSSSLDEIDLNSTTFSANSGPATSASSFFGVPVYNNQFFDPNTAISHSNYSNNNHNNNDDENIVSTEKSVLPSDDIFEVMKPNSSYDHPVSISSNHDQNNHIVSILPSSSSSSSSVLETSGLQDISFDNNEEDEEDDDDRVEEEVDNHDGHSSTNSNNNTTSKKLFSDSPDHYNHLHQQHQQQQQEKDHHHHRNGDKSEHDIQQVSSSHSSIQIDLPNPSMIMTHLPPQQQQQQVLLPSSSSSSSSSSYTDANNTNKLTDMNAALPQQDDHHHHEEQYKQQLEVKEQEISKLLQQLSQANAAMNQYETDMNEMRNLTVIERQESQLQCQQLQQQLQLQQQEQQLQLQQQQQFEQQQQKYELIIEQQKKQYDIILLEYEDRLKHAEEIAWQAKAEQAELLFARECDGKKIQRLLENEVVLTEKEVVLRNQVEVLTVQLHELEAGGIVTVNTKSIMTNDATTAANTTTTTATTNTTDVVNNTDNSASSDMTIPLHHQQEQQLKDLQQQQQQQQMQQQQQQQQSLEMKINKYKSSMKEVSHKLHTILAHFKPSNHTNQYSSGGSSNVNNSNSNNKDADGTVNKDENVVVLIDNNTTGAASLNILRHQIESIQKRLETFLTENTELSTALELIDHSLSALTSSSSSSWPLTQSSIANDSDHQQQQPQHEHEQMMLSISETSSSSSSVPVFHSQWLMELVQRVQKSVHSHIQNSNKISDEMMMMRKKLMEHDEAVKNIDDSSHISTLSINQQQQQQMEEQQQQQHQVEEELKQKDRFESLQKNHADDIHQFTTRIQQLIENNTILEAQLKAQLVVVDSLMSEKKTAESSLREQQTKVIELMQSVQSREQVDKEHRESREKAEALSIQMNSLKQQAVKFETENKQLHQVISQLRQVRKAGKEDSDTIIIERDDLKLRNAALQAELIRLQDTISSTAQDLNTITQLQQDLLTKTTYSQTLEQSMNALQTEYNQLQHKHYDVSKELSIMHSDISLIQQDLQQRNIECMNLKLACENMMKNHSIELKRVQDANIHQLEIKEKEWLLKIENLQNDHNNHNDEQNIMITQLQQKVNDEALFRRKLEIDMNTEKRRMAKTLDGALAQLQNSRDDVVDRVLIANLIVNYFHRKRSMDVLELIAKILAFTDEQKVIIGLKSSHSPSLISSLLTTVVGSQSTAAPPVNVEGDNLAELWVNFLLLESDGDNDHTNNSHNNSNSSSGSGVNNSNGDMHVGHMRHTQPPPLSPREIIEMNRQSQLSSSSSSSHQR